MAVAFVRADNTLLNPWLLLSFACAFLQRGYTTLHDTSHMTLAGEEMLFFVPLQLLTDTLSPS